MRPINIDEFIRHIDLQEPPRYLNDSLERMAAEFLKRVKTYRQDDYRGHLGVCAANPYRDINKYYGDDDLLDDE